jgi:hypothetical protein
MHLNMFGSERFAVSFNSLAAITSPMGDRTCYREYCPDCDAEVTIVTEECPECGRALSLD